MKKIVLSCALMLSVAFSSLSDERVYENTKAEFESTDSNKDNIVTLEEMVLSFDELLNAGFDENKLQKLTKEMFDQYDKDDNGLDWDEYLNMTMSKIEKQRQESERKRLDPPELDSI